MRCSKQNTVGHFFLDFFLKRCETDTFKVIYMGCQENLLSIEATPFYSPIAE